MRPAYIALGLLMAALVGCGKRETALEPVHGRVDLDGIPLAGKTLQFIPEPGTAGQGAGASTDKDGNYTLLAVRPGATHDMAGAPAGAYRVVVTEPMFPIDFPVQKSDESQPVPAIGPPTGPRKAPKQVIPPAYQNADTTPLRVEVPKKGGVINLELVTPAEGNK
jgi:hypothetical protein